MLASITPLGQRGRGASWRRTVVAYVVGSAFGGVILGAVLGTAGDVLDLGGSTAVVAVAAAAALLGAVSDLRGPPPSISRQVDETWIGRYRDWVYGLGFGLQLGLGAVTIVTSASLYLTWVLELVSARPGVGAAIGAVFGLARALPLLTAASVHDPHALRAAHRRWAAAVRPAAAVTTSAQALAAVALLAVAV